jgi:hypothetical protein
MAEFLVWACRFLILRVRRRASRSFTGSSCLSSGFYNNLGGATRTEWIGGVKLAKLGLAREIEAKPGALILRRDYAGQGYALRLTAAGLKAIAVDEGSQDTIEPSVAPQTREGLGLKAGALLVREWNGRLERVMILEEGFAWNGQTFGSLSQIAKAMTGTNWNGHRFFGLRQGKMPAAGADRRKRRDRTAVCKENGGSPRAPS